jgi:hypothetical protein
VGHGAGTHFTLLYWYNSANTDAAAAQTNVSEGDYFGLDMLRLRKDLKTVTLTVAHPFQSRLSLEVRFSSHCTDVC